MTQVKNRDSRRSYNTQIIAEVFLGLEPRLVGEPPSDTVHAAYYKDMKKKIMRALLVCRHVRLSRCPHHNTKYRPACQTLGTHALASVTCLSSTAQMDSWPVMEPNQLIRIMMKKASSKRAQVEN